MKPVVAVIAAGGMGAPVGRRLVENGVRVLTSLEGRSAGKRRSARRPPAWSRRAIAEIAQRRFRALDRAAGGSVAAGTAARAGLTRRQQESRFMPIATP